MYHIPRIRNVTITIIFFITGWGLNSVLAQDPYVSGENYPQSQEAYDVTFYDLTISVDPQKKSISGIQVIHADIVDLLEQFIFDLDTVFRIRSVVINDAQHSYVRKNGRVKVLLNKSYYKGQSIVVTIDYEGRPRPAVYPPYYGGFYREGPDHSTSVVCPMNGADLWWPCKDQLYDEADSIHFSIRYPNTFTCISNGSLTDEIHTTDSQVVRKYRTGKPVNNYGLSFYLGIYETKEKSFKSTSGQKFPVVVNYQPGNDSLAEILLFKIPEYLSFLEKHLGPYPFQDHGLQVTLGDYNMEHQTNLMIHTAQFRNDSDHALPLLHEISQEWFGNMVTAAYWEELWIHEALPAYMEFLFYEESGQKGLANTFLQHHRERIIEGKSLSLRDGHRNSYEQFYVNDTSDTWYSTESTGIWMVHTLRQVMGDEAFLKLLGQFAQPPHRKSPFRTTGSNEFFKVAESVSGMDLGWFMNQYLYEGDLPVLLIEKTQDAYILNWLATPGFQLPVQVAVSGQTPMTITPTTAHPAILKVRPEDEMNLLSSEALLMNIQWKKQPLPAATE